MNPVIDLNKEYGIVLEGGGAKGAYQVGAWRALVEAGVKIKGISGTSVGALNGAMMCMGALDQAEKLWKNLTYSKVINVEDEQMEKILDRDFEAIRNAIPNMAEIVGERGLDITPLRRLIEENIEEEKIRTSNRELYIKTFRVDDFRELDIDLKKAEPGRMKDYLLASAYLFPVFRNERLHGKRYLDGGIVNNVPLDSLVKRGYEDIIMIRIFGLGRSKKVKIPQGTTVYSIEPKTNLGSILEFNGKKCAYNIKLGYFDAKRLIYGLKGSIYYIEENQEECYYLKHLLQLSRNGLERLVYGFHRKEEESQWIRCMCETILPQLASDLKLSKKWNYKELYIACLEATAKVCNIPKLQIYTLEDLEGMVSEKIKEMHLMDKKEMPLFSVFFDEECKKE